MELIIIIFTLLHVTFFLILTVIWEGGKKVKGSQILSDHSGLSVIIPIRNEEGNIRALIQNLSNQSLPFHLFEVIVVDDHSTDQSMQILSDTIADHKLNISLYALPLDKKGKKAAATLGVSKATYDWIVCTDADCKPHPQWLQTLSKYFLTENAVMLTAPVKIVGKGIFQKFQSIEFSALIGYGAVTLELDQPTMCNGANMAYKKSAFLAVNGYEGNEHIPTGDDEFLLQKINKSFPNQIKFVQDPEAIVTTAAKTSLGELINQRVRWTSKWKNHKNTYVYVSACLVFLDFLVSLYILYSLFFGQYWMFLLWFVRFLSEYSYARQTMRFSGINYQMYHMLMLSIIYPFYAVFLGIASIFGNYSWKDRYY